MGSLDQVKIQIRFGLDQLSSRNAHHVFEDLCRHLGRARICSNILPATGPVSAGGDQGRDFETFRTYLLASPIASSSFVGLASALPIAFACSLEKRYVSKIKADIAMITAAGTPLDSVHCFSTQDIPIAQRHKLQTWAREKHSVHLEIYDANAIAELLSDAQVFWIAERFLNIPSEIFPRPTDHASSDWYAEVLQKWKSGPHWVNDAAFVSVKAATRHATEEATVDLSFWIGVLGEFTTLCPTEFLRRKARYEIVIASLKGFDNLYGHEESLRTYFAAIPQLDDTAAVEDACILVNVCTGAAHLNRIQLALDEIHDWRGQLIHLIGARIDIASSASLRCRWLELAGYIGMSADPLLRQKPDFDVAFARWFELTDLIREAPLFPLEEFADRLTQYSVFIGDHPRYDELAHRVDELLSERCGGFVAAEKCRDRALAFYDAGKILRAVEELHRAKVQWFAEETLGGALLAVLLLANCYRRLKLTWAAKYHAFAAAFMAIHSDHHELRKKLPDALISAAECDYTEGAWSGCLEVTETAVRMHALISDSVGDLDKHPEFQRVVHYTTLLMTITERLDPSLFGFVAQTVHAWGFGELLEQMFRTGRDALSKLDGEKLWEISVKQLAGRPFGDLGQYRATSWLQLGVTWIVKWHNTYDSTATAEELVAVLQIALAEFAGQDLALLPTTVRINFELVAVSSITAEALPSNAGREWKMIVPVDSVTRYTDIDQYQVEILTAVVVVLREISLLPSEDFYKKLHDAWKNGMSSKAFVAQRYETIYRQVIPEWRFQRAERMSRVVPEAHKPFLPTGAEETKWFDARPSSFTEADSLERIQSRYDKTTPALRLTLPRLKQRPEFVATVNQLREAGWKDWHILLAMFNVVINWRMRMLYELPRELERAKSYPKEMSDLPEAESAPVVPSSEFTAEHLRDCLRISMLNTVEKLGLELHQDTPDFEAIERFLGTRYGYWSEDVPHVDPFA